MDDMPPDDQTHSPRYRCRVFVDFWNYTLSMRGVEEGFRTDWSRLGPVLSSAAAKVVDASAAGEYQGLNVYGSYDPERDASLHRWATRTLDTFPGVSVWMARRQKKRSPPVCPRCQAAAEKCAACGADMRGTEEKGVDVRMATDIISLAWIENYDIAVLVSSDRDFVPLAGFLETRGIKVVHGAFPPKGAQLTARCWAGINVGRLREQFRR